MIEIRSSQDGELLFGELPWASTALVGGRSERFRPGGLHRPAGRPVHLLREHDPRTPLSSTDAGLEVRSDDEALSFAVPLSKLPDTTVVRDTLAEVRARVRLGLSPGFSGAVRETRADGGVEIVSAVLCELSLVTRPAYPGQVAVRGDDGVEWLVPAAGEMLRRTRRWWM